jgi:hypothetical protein
VRQTLSNSHYIPGSEIIKGRSSANKRSTQHKDYVTMDESSMKVDMGERREWGIHRDRYSSPVECPKSHQNARK